MWLFFLFCHLFVFVMHVFVCLLGGICELIGLSAGFCLVRLLLVRLLVLCGMGLQQVEKVWGCFCCVSILELGDDGG